MKKLFALAAALLVSGFGLNAMAHDVFEGTYVNNAGKVVIAPAPQGSNANYDVTISDASGKCLVKISAATNKVTATGKNGAVYNINTIAAVESADYPAFSMWPEDHTIRLAPDALPFEKLDPACQAFKDNLVFNRQN